MNTQNFKRYFDEILHAEENARDTIEGAIKEKYITYFNFLIKFFLYSPSKIYIEYDPILKISYIEMVLIKDSKRIRLLIMKYFHLL